jgi:hypothetical protein
VVVVVVALVEGDAPDVLSVELLPLPLVPGAPIELVLPDVPPLVEPGVVVLPAVLPPMALEEPLVLPEPLVPGEPLLPLEVEVSLLGAGFVVEELDDEVGAGVVVSRLVQAPSETAATNASAAHEVRDAFIRELLEGCSKVARACMTALWAL